MKRFQLRADGYSELRVTKRAPRGKMAARVRIKCGDCDNALDIYHDDDALEIGGVHGSVQNWREILLPLLGSPP